jgi:hypothetical protein
MTLRQMGQFVQLSECLVTVNIGVRKVRKYGWFDSVLYPK